MSLSSFFKNLFKSKSVSNNYKPQPLILAAKVLDVQKHPNADRLRVVKLDVGEGKIVDPAGKAVSVVEPVVCGAWNFEAGDMVVLALPGATIAQNIHSDTHESFTLGTAKLRGIESQGMICAGFELGLTNEPGDTPEILILKPETPPGSAFEPNMI